MKKLFTTSLISILVLSFSSCSLFNNTPKEFSSDYVLTQELADKFVSRENPKDISYAGPFYNGNFDGIQEASQEYFKLRREKVTEIRNVMQKSLDKLYSFETLILELSNIKKSYLEELIGVDANFQKSLQLFNSSTNFEVLISSINELKNLQKQIEGMNDGPERGFFEYALYSQNFKLADAITRSIAGDLANLGAIYSLIEKIEGDNFKIINQTLTDKINNFSKNSDTIFDEVYYQIALLHNGEKILFTSDYYYAKEASLHFDKQLLELKKSIDGYKTKKGISPKIIEVIKSKYQKYSADNEAMKKYLEENSKNPLLISEQISSSSNFFIDQVFAYQTDFFNSLSRNMESGIRSVKGVKDFAVRLFQDGAKEAKKAYVKYGGQEIVKDAGQIVGAGLDLANQAVELGVDTVQGVYFQDTSFEDLQKNIAKRKANFQEKLVRGSLGKGQYDEALKIVGNIEKSADKVIDGTSELVGMTAGATVGAITQDAKLGRDLGKFTTEVVKDMATETREKLDTHMMLLKNGAIILHPDTGVEETLGSAYKLGGTIMSQLKSKKQLEEEKKAEEEANKEDDDEDKENPYIKDFKDKAIAKIKKDTGIKEIEDNISNITDSENYLQGLKESLEGDIGTAIESTLTSESKKEVEIIKTALQKKTNNGLPTEEELLKEFFDLVDKELAKDESKKGQAKSETKNAEIGTDQKKPEKIKEEVKVVDIDKDGVLDEKDNCISVANSDQANKDGDSFGDACDDTYDKEVGANGTFSGDYEGALVLHFKPVPNSSINGTMINKYGTIHINGSIDENMNINASLSGNVEFEAWDGEQVTKDTCSMKGTFKGNIGENKASGNYSGTCKDFTGNGPWSVTF